MDLRNLMNDEKSEGQGDGDGRSTSATATATVPAPPNAQPSTPSQYGHSSHQQTPMYGPPSAGGIASRPQAHGMTPLRTPSQTMTAQYPFPQSQQSPISASHSQQHRPFESQPAGHLSRPGSHGHPHQNAQAASVPYSGHTPVQQQNSYASISPTPPSHLSRTPSSMRQSPLATMSQLPSQQQAQHAQQQYSQQYPQPSTPLGPPQHYPQRAPTFPETQSPYRQRSFSNASNSMVSGSPAQHHPGIPNLVESPNAYARPSPQHTHSRQPSEYMSQRGSRERSISVSPKTRPPARLPSLGSRQSSNPQEIYSARASEQYSGAPLAGSPNHVMQQPIPAPQSQPQSRYDAHPNAASEVSQTTPISLQPAPRMYPPGAQSSSLSSQSGNQASQPPPSNIQHQSQKMGMSHLVTPASEIPPQINGHSSSQSGPAVKSEQSATGFTREAAPDDQAHDAPPPSLPQFQSTHQQTSNSDRPMADAPAVTNGAPPTADANGEAKGSLKRPASSSNSLDEPPTKQVKASTSKKHNVRPIWARLSKHNPKSDGQGTVNGAVEHRRPGARVNGGTPRPASNMPQNGVSGQTELVDKHLAEVQSILGRKWEPSWANTQPLPDTKRHIAEWMFQELTNLQDVGTDPYYGAVEIEGKIGTLARKDTGERCNLPVLTSTILHPQYAEQFRFESRMAEYEHAHMNKRLNKAVEDAKKDPSRVQMRYEHFTDIDSFAPLSPTGLDALPPSIRSRATHHGHTPRLRTTLRHEKGKAPYVAARIVKVNVAHLHVFSPADPYDLRISINVEVNLSRPDLDPASLILPSSSDTNNNNAKDASLDRRKDRISYTHLAYSIDLTRVDVQTPETRAKKNAQSDNPVYELEIEVDAKVLREQMRAAQAGARHAYGDVVEGFWDDAVLLMRERAPVPR